MRQANQASQARAEPERQAAGGAPPQRSSTVRARGSLLGLPQALGNRAVLHLLSTRRIQPKLRIGPSGDVFEQEADRVARAVVSMSRTGMAEGAGSLRSAPAGGIQRKCAKCEEEEEETLRRSPADGADAAAESIGEQEAAPPATETTPEYPATEQAPEEQASAEAGPEHAAGAMLLVEDEAEEVGPGQMRKSEFVAALRESVCATANEAMASTGQTTENCPWMGYWFDQAEQKDAAYVEKFLRKYAPETAGAATAQEFIPLVAARVRRSVDVWVKTGEITGVPEGVSTEAPGAGSAEGGGQASPGAGVLFKARPGGARRISDPAAIRSQLGMGHPLPGGVRSRMESAFGLSFSQVRLHTDSGAAALSDQMNARAFTVGAHVAFGPSEYRPGTLVGDALLAHELAHVVQQGGATSRATMANSPETTGFLEADADRSAAATVYSLFGEATGALSRITIDASPLIRSGLRLQRCSKSPREKEIERLGSLQFGFMEEKRKAEEERLKKEAAEDAKKKGLPPPVNEPKVEMGDVIKKEQEQYALKASPTTEWDNADQPAWNKKAAAAWTAVVASVKGTELEGIAKGVIFEFNPKRALEEGFYAKQSGHTLIVGMSWVRFAEQDPKNAWENLAHEMAGHLKYGVTYAQEIMESALSKLSSADRTRFIGDARKFFETYEYPETEIYASVWQRRYRVPVAGAELPSGGIHPDKNIDNKLRVMNDVLHPEVAKAVLKELKRRVDANKEILQRDKDFFVAKVKEIFGYDI